MPANPGVAIVLVTHMDPKHESHMASVLDRMTPMAVREAKEGMRVERDHVYVIPPDTHLSLRDGAFHLQPREAAKGHQHVIDRFLRSLAEDRGAQAIGVILSGALSDGTLGLRDIRAAGGFTFAQSIETAGHRAIPWN